VGTETQTLMALKTEAQEVQTIVLEINLLETGEAKEGKVDIGCWFMVVGQTTILCILDWILQSNNKQPKTSNYN